jgi:hypothetical protein
MSTIKQRFGFLNKTLKKNLIEICKSNNIVYKDNNDKRIKKKYIIDNILKNEFSENELQIFNEPCENLVDKNNREKILKLYKNNELKNILQNYNLSTNGIKKYLIDRILNYEYNNKIVTLKEQKSQEFYLEVSSVEITDNTLHIPQKFNINNNRIYNLDIVYEPTYFKNVIEYMKHLENLRYLNYSYLIESHLGLLNQINSNLYNSILYYLGLIGWQINDNSYIDSIEDYVNNKYKVKENNVKKAENIKVIDNICSDCTICLCNIEKKDKCKKLPCNHTFHSECITKWLNVDLHCPICRFEIV